MAESFDDKLARIKGKMIVLVERYHALENRFHELESECRNKEAENLKLRKEIDSLNIQLEHARVVRAWVSTQEQQVQSRAILSQLVRDVEKCIAQLNKE